MHDSSVFVFMQYCPASIGEQVVQIPFFRFLRERYPEDRIVAVAPDRSGQVIDELGLVDEMHVYPIENDISRLRRIVSTLQPVCSMSKITNSAPASPAMRLMPPVSNSKTNVPSEGSPDCNRRLTGLIRIVGSLLSLVLGSLVRP